MTDKQIIIDGVDVSGCPYYCGHDICKNTCHYFCTPCEWVNVQNCTYKQFKQAEQTVEECHKYQTELEDKLKAKEQECEELKIYIESNEQQVKEVETLVMDNDRLINELDQLKFDYAELEKRHNDSFEQFRQLKAENKHLNDLLNQALKELEKTRETLTEIKEIAEQILDDDDNHCPFELTKQILQKINECEGNND